MSEKKHGTVLITANGQEVNVVSAADCDDDDDNDYITNFQNKFSTKKSCSPNARPCVHQQYVGSA
jgi:hypothetical protein